MYQNIVRKIALYGGAFDPPHKGHLSLIANLASLDVINQVWILPCGDRTDKKLLLSKDERFQLLNQLASNIMLERRQKQDKQVMIKISEQEILLSKKLNRMIPTIQLLDHLGQKFKQCQFYFVIGADLLESIHTWQKYKNLLKEHKFIIYPRQGYQYITSILKQHQYKKQVKHDNKDNQLKSQKEVIVVSNIPLNYYYNQFYPVKISSSYIKSTLIDQKLSKKQKRMRVQQFLDDLTLQALSNKLYL